MASPNQVNVVLDDESFRKLKECAEIDDRKMAAVARRILAENLPVYLARLKTASAVLNDEATVKYRVRRKSK